MTALRGEIATWLRELYEPGSGPHTDKEMRYTHMIVACDTWDWENYPVFVKEGEDVQERAKELSSDDFGRIDEVYSANHGFEEQMAERRAFHYD